MIEEGLLIATQQRALLVHAPYSLVVKKVTGFVVYYRLLRAGASQHKYRRSSTKLFKISAAATAAAELARGPSASLAVQTVPHHAPSSAVEVQV